MIDLGGQIEGPITIEQDTALLGEVTSDVTVRAATRFELHGTVTGNLIVEPSAAVIVRGEVGGTLINYGAHVVVFGRIGAVSDLGQPTTEIKLEAKVGA